MDDQKDPSLDPLVAAIGLMFRKNPRVRGAIRTLAGELLAYLDSLEESQRGGEPHSAEIREAVAPQAMDPTLQLKVMQDAESAGGSIAATPQPRVETQLQLGDAVFKVQAIDEPAAKGDWRSAGFVGPVVVETAPENLSAPETDLVLIAKRSRVKAEACRWSVERRRRLEAGEDFRDFADGYRELVARAKSMPNCYLWMIDPRGPSLPADEMMQTLAGCYDTLAQGAELVTWLLEIPEAEQKFNRSVLSAGRGAVGASGGIAGSAVHRRGPGPARHLLVAAQ